MVSSEMAKTDRTPVNQNTAITCPKCGHFGKPFAKSTEEISPVELVPVLGDALAAYRTACTRLYCDKCGTQLAESLIDKSRKTKDSLRAFSARISKPWR